MALMARESLVPRSQKWNELTLLFKKTKAEMKSAMLPEYFNEK